MPMTSQMRKEASPPPNKPLPRIGGKRRPPPGELHVVQEFKTRWNFVFQKLKCV